jgi:hypothetical protein
LNCRFENVSIYWIIVNCRVSQLDERERESMDVWSVINENEMYIVTDRFGWSTLVLIRLNIKHEMSTRFYLLVQSKITYLQSFLTKKTNSIFEIKFYFEGQIENKIDLFC